MWEVYTLGKLPYFTLKNTDVIEHVKRTQPPLHRPDKINTDVYNIMKSCWEKVWFLLPFLLELVHLSICPCVRLVTDANNYHFVLLIIFILKTRKCCF